MYPHWHSIINFATCVFSEKCDLNGVLGLGVGHGLGAAAAAGVIYLFVYYWQPCFFGQRTGSFLLSARKNFAEVLDRRFNHICMFFKKTQCSSISFAGSMDNSFNNPANGFLSKCKKKSHRVSRKWKNYKTPEKTEFSTNDPLNLFNAVFRAVAKLYKQKFDVFSLMSELKAERVPVNPLKSFLSTRCMQSWKPHGKTIDKILKKKNVVIFRRVKCSLLNSSAHTLNAALTNFTEVFSAKVLKNVAERPKLSNK